ncbi:hypothetical protein A6A08_02135 [Nocardiopsis sp. TSRI0078]|uniref:hypothetical protein n=1 Tax=unclassified Nocardiopsis TaxID=2649073 RepID=UPI00093BA331|nr:hypothetical protein [Nocardiopsis sp. TSRI0078]OKI23594.1 hypothetical protein A6A08_02135 [Nocardiopsis sp. TSRI0078]
MEIVRAEHVARLLSTQDGDPVLIVHRGRAEVVDAAELDDPGYEGALRVAERGDLVPDKGGEPTQEEAETLARRLDTAVRNLGG